MNNFGSGFQKIIHLRFKLKCSLKKLDQHKVWEVNFALFFAVLVYRNYFNYMLRALSSPCTYTAQREYIVQNI